MNKTLTLLMILASLPTLALASGNQSPLIKSAVAPGFLPNMPLPAYISIKSMANPSITYSNGNAVLGVTVSGAAQAKDEKNLDSLLSAVSLKPLRDGGLEIDVKASGMYSCNISTMNGIVTRVSGQCLTNVEVNFPGASQIPLYLNGVFKPLE